uniref:Uncharacterized protein n=1 Tax=Tanacetum cinerariifolium TaxID=118510 RepID=A0A699JLY0_TANCI|nr:hypothetical protein [Tanacetum cinerariifolium]
MKFKSFLIHLHNAISIYTCVRYVKAILTMVMNVRNESRLSMSQNRATFKTLVIMTIHMTSQECTCEFCGNGAHVGYNCPAQVPSFQTLPSFPQQYLCCEDCGGLHEADHCQPPQYTVNHPIFNAHNDLLNAQNKLTEQMTQLTSMYEMACQIIQKKQEEKRIEEEQAANTRYWKIPTCCDDDDDYNSAITPNEPSCVENLVPNPSESEGENGCDVPTCFTTFSNILFNVDYEFNSSENQSCFDEGVPEKIFSNPLFEEEIIPIKIDQHHDNAESTHDSSLIILSKIDYLLDEFAGELTLLKSIPPGIDKTYCHPENEIRLTKRLLYDNSSPRPPKEFVSKNSNANIESFSHSPIPIKDSDSFLKEIDLTVTPDDPMPSGMEKDDDDSERDILIFEELLDNYSLSLPVIESYHFDIPSFSRSPAKPPDGNTRILNIKMMGDVSDKKVPITGLTITRVPNQEKSPDLLSHRSFETFQPFTGCSMMVHGKNIPILDVPLFHFYPLDQLKYGGNWVKLSDLKQALRGGTPCLSYSWKFEDSYQRILSSKSSFPQLQLGINLLHLAGSQPMLKSSYKAEAGVIISFPSLVRGVADVVVEIKGTDVYYDYSNK